MRREFVPIAGVTKKEPKPMTTATDYSRYTLTHSVLEGNLFNEDTADIDTAASTAKFRDMLIDAVEQKFPGLNIKIDVQYGTEGYTREASVSLPSLGEDEDPSEQYATEQEILDAYNAANERIFGKYDWIINKGA